MRQLDFSGRPVLSLQAMLRIISFRYPQFPHLTPTGLFDEETLEAVMIFQRDFFPPVTGQVDNATWDAVVTLYRKVLRSLQPPRLFTGYPDRDYTISPGEESIHLNLIQSMFLSLSTLLEGLEAGTVTGVLDRPTQHNIRWIQRLNSAPETGTMDAAVWNTLARLYTIFIVRA